MSEREEPSEQPCREGPTIPPFVPPPPPIPPPTPPGPPVRPTTTGVGMFSALITTYAQMQGVIVTTPPPSGTSAVLILDYEILQDYTDPTNAHIVIPPEVTISVTSMWVRLESAPTTNDVPVQLLKNGVKVGLILSFPIVTPNLVQHAVENVAYAPGDTLFYSGGDQLFDFIFSMVALTYTTT